VRGVEDMKLDDRATWNAVQCNASTISELKKFLKGKQDVPNRFIVKIKNNNEPGGWLIEEAFPNELPAGDIDLQIVKR
jgi:hypothetical protein